MPVLKADKAYRIEKDVKASVKKVLDHHEWFWWMPAANAYGKTGTSDFLAMKNGVFIAVETKFGSNKPSAMQRAFLHSINAEGGIGFVVNEKNIGAFDEWMELFMSQSKAAHDAQDPTYTIPAEQGARMLDLMQILTEDL